MWTGSRFRNGYGALIIGRTPVGAHRIAWVLAHESVPDELNVCHRCDVRACINPDHLFLGTQFDNMADASEKGRFRVPHTTRQLTPADRLSIYEAPARPGIGVELARHYGVTKTCISLIRRGRFVRSSANRRASARPAPLTCGDRHV